jgi:hypothetical protein
MYHEARRTVIAARVQTLAAALVFRLQGRGLKQPIRVRAAVRRSLLRVRVLEQRSHLCALIRNEFAWRGARPSSVEAERSLPRIGVRLHAFLEAVV